MTLIMGVVLFMGVLLWRADSSWEWGIPQKWQAKIGGWKEGFVSRTHILNYDWYLGPENRELEKHFWHLQMEYPRLRKKFITPVKVEVCVHPNFSPDYNEIYISCLQRRFPEIKIYERSERGHGDRYTV